MRLRRGTDEARSRGSGDLRTSFVCHGLPSSSLLCLFCFYLCLFLAAMYNFGRGRRVFLWLSLRRSRGLLVADGRHLFRRKVHAFLNQTLKTQMNEKTAAW